VKLEASWDEVTKVDIIASTPSALTAIVLGADELEVLQALADLEPRGEAALSAVHTWQDAAIARRAGVQS